MSNPLTIAAVPAPDGGPGIAASGEIDQNNAHLLQRALQDRTAGGQPVHVDLSQVTYLDSAGLAVLFAYRGQIRVLAAKVLQPVMEITGLTTTCAVEIAGE
jgi:anti-anti-sigma factor